MVYEGGRPGRFSRCVLGAVLVALSQLAVVSIIRAEPSPSPAPGAGPFEQIDAKDLGGKKIETSPDVVTELILDASGSMKEKVQSRTKLFQAKRVLKSFMTQAHNDNMVLGLRVYGQKEKDCKDSKLVLKFGEKGADAIEGAMRSIDPKGYGKTPLALSLTNASEDLKKHPDKPKRIIVVTDGVETCGGDPCAIAKKLKQELDVRIFVIGYHLNDEQREQLKCLAQFGGMFDANDLSSLLNALKELSNKDKNLFVKSPDPLGISVLYEVRKDGSRHRVGEFVSSIGTRVEPGIRYEVVVLLDPNYTFQNVVLEANERRTLEVKGNGTVLISFMEKLFTVQLLNEQGSIVTTFPSDEETKVPAGFYKIQAVSPPFAEALIDDIRVVPNGRYEEKIREFGAMQIDTDKHHGPGPYGMYVFDDKKKTDIGSYLTGVPLVLPLSRFTIKSVGNAMLKNIYPENGKIARYPLPPPGQTVTFKRKDDDKPSPKEDESKGPVMLDSLTPQQLQDHIEKQDKKLNR